MKPARFVFFCMAFFICISSEPAQARVVRDAGTNPANGHRYYLLSPNSWTKAEAEAIKLGGHLVTVNDAQENDWVCNTFLDANYIWIGLNDTSLEGRFVWSSGEQSTYRNWFSGEPNDFGGDEDFVHIYNFDSAYRAWNDYKDDKSFGSSTIYGVAEVPIPEPSSVSVLLTGLGCTWLLRKRRQTQR